jgi:hypothetical protein
MQDRCWHSHWQLKRKRKPIRGTVWMGKGAQHVARRATTFRQGRGGRPPLDFQAEKGQTSGVVAVAEPAPVVGHGGNPPPGPLPDVGGEKGLNNESAAVEGGEGQLLVGHDDRPPPGPPPG